MLKSLKAKRQALAAGLSVLSIQAFAALPTAVTGAITTAQDDGKELGWAMLGLAVVVGVVFWLKRKV